MKKPIAVKINNEEEYRLAIEALDLAGFKWFFYPEEEHMSAKEQDSKEFCIIVDPTIYRLDYDRNTCVYCLESIDDSDCCNFLELSHFVDFFSSMTMCGFIEFLDSYSTETDEDEEDKSTITEYTDDKPIDVKDIWNMWKEKNETECVLCGSRMIEDVIGDPHKVKCRACGNVFYRDDEVYHPTHYTEGKHEVMDIIKEILTGEEYIGYLKGNIIKYSWRAGLKGESI